MTKMIVDTAKPLSITVHHHHHHRQGRSRELQGLRLIWEPNPLQVSVRFGWQSDDAATILLRDLHDDDDCFSPISSLQEGSTMLSHPALSHRWQLCSLFESHEQLPHGRRRRSLPFVATIPASYCGSRTAVWDQDHHQPARPEQQPGMARRSRASEDAWNPSISISRCLLTRSFLQHARRN